MLQDASLVMWDKFDTRHPPDDFTAWGCRIAYFKVLDFYKKDRRARVRFSQAMLERVAETVSCPDCIDLSVADSPSITARHLRATIADRLRRGWTPDRIRADLVARFGASILETPPAHGIDLLAWIAPALLVAFGLGLIGFTLLRWSRGGPSPAPPPEPLGDADRRLLERELAVAEGDVE